MWQKYLVILSFFSLLFLTSCGIQHRQIITFDGKSFVLATEELEYVRMTSPSSDYSLFGEDLEVVYVESGVAQTGALSNFLNSFAFLQSSLASDIDVQSFFSANQEQLFRYFEGLELAEVKDFSILCHNAHIPSVIQEFSFLVSLWEKQFYGVQLYYVEHNVGTIISFLSDDENDRAEFTRSLRSFSCK